MSSHLFNATSFRSVAALATIGTIPLLVPTLSGCDTQAYCFSDDCKGDTSTGTTIGGGGEGGTGASTAQFQGGSTGQFSGGGGEGGSGGCMESNGGIEICDDVDNDCNDIVDDIDGIDYSDPKTCGTCANNCYQVLLNVNPSTITCTESDDPGNEPGTCEGECATDYHDLDGDGPCEYYCITSAADDSACNAKDDDCDGSIDEDVDVCDDANNCGTCGRICVVPNGTPECVHLDANPVCTPANTECRIDDCDLNWHDLDGEYETGCEYFCIPSGPEVCDGGIDNDCDGLVDSADDLSGDPDIDVVCVGDDDGVCAEPDHEGLTACVAGQVACTGPDVLFEGDEVEMCNGEDDDCDGTDDDDPADDGQPCGTSGNAPCTFGTEQCQNGQLVCVGNVEPTTETCNGVDDNCDGRIDRTGPAPGIPPADSMGACNVPIPPPPGATSPCVAGTRACQGGVIVCNGSVGPTSTQDTCGRDANCDGTLTNQPNLQTDTLNCGSCGNNCNANQGTNHQVRRCTMGTCTFVECAPGYHDLDNNGSCEYGPCFFQSAQEICNGVDDDCDGTVDEQVLAPSPKQVCGVSPAASAAECTTQVAVSCVTSGNPPTTGWQCAFPAGVCPGGCSANDEICDGLDNDCDGNVNENVPDFGAPCSSDDMNPGSQGECARPGTRVCNGPNATRCGAMAVTCTQNGGCTETCDGKDNDCDGSVDEPFTAKGTDMTNFYKPNVVRVADENGNNPMWIYRFESSRPNADDTVPGSGNGYWTSAPTGETLGRTRSCSEEDKIPWFNVTPREAEQTCIAAGGQLCSVTTWRDACHVGPPAAASCLYGYGPFAASSNCRSSYTAAGNTARCNLGPSFDFNAMATGDQDGLLPTGSDDLTNCFADWRNVAGNGNTVFAQIFDITGNLREITRSTTPNQYTLMGGAFNSQSESGSSCDFTFYTVTNTFKFFDTGFRCCFSQNPTL